MPDSLPFRDSHLRSICKEMEEKLRQKSVKKIVFTAVLGLFSAENQRNGACVSSMCTGVWRSMFSRKLLLQYLSFFSCLLSAKTSLLLPSVSQISISAAICVYSSLTHDPKPWPSMTVLSIWWPLIDLFQANATITTPRNARLCVHICFL